MRSAGPGGVAPRDRDAWREPPLHKILAVPDENLVGAWAITNASPGVGLSRPPSPAATTRAGLPSIRSARASRGREIVAARGLHDRLQPATRSMPRPGRGPRPAASRSPQKLVVRLCARDRAAVQIRARLACHAAKCFAAPGDTGPVRSLRICSKMRHVTHGGRLRSIRTLARGFVRRYTHAGPWRVRASMRSDPCVVSVRSLMRQARRGTRALILCVATC